MVEALPNDVQSARDAINGLGKKFNGLRDFIRECIEGKNIAVEEVATVIKLISPDNDDASRKMFQDSCVTVIGTATNHSELFGTMNFHWNYLDPSLLDHVSEKLGLEEVKEGMEVYKSDLEEFKKRTPLTVFCKIQKGRKMKFSAEFQELIVEFDLPENVKLEIVEQFRQDYTSHYNLRESTMMIAQVSQGCFVITWLIPESVVDKLKGNVPREILKKYCVAKLKIAGACIYRSQRRKKVGAVSASSTTSNLSQPTLEIALVRAVSKDEIETVESLLSSGAPPNPLSSEFESTALMEACVAGNVEMCCLLLDKGAKPNLKNHQGWTALMAATNKNRYGCVDILLVRGADPDIQNNRGWTALMAAVHNGFTDVALRIVRAGARPHIPHKTGTNALLLAIPTNKKEVVDCLLDHVERSHLDLKDEEGNTALILACRNRNLTLVRRLLLMNANKDVHNNYGETPVMIARELGEEDILEELVNNSANQNSVQ